MERKTKTNTDKYNATFPKILRALEEHHPADGRATTHKALADAVGVRPQTISLYAAGETQPTPDTLLKISEYFGVSVDYLLTGVSSKNKKMHDSLGLSEKAISLLKHAKEEDTDNKFPPAIELINYLLSDDSFYKFLSGLGKKMIKTRLDIFKAIEEDVDEDTIIRYYFWDIDTYVHDFVHAKLAELDFDEYYNE